MASRTEQNRFDAIVVGAGVIGLACAWRAAEEGARVLVLDRGDQPAGATRVAAGMLAPVGELQFGEEALLEMTLAATASYPDFVAELEAASDLPAGYSPCGALHIALDRDEAVELRRRHELQRSRGLDAEWLSPRQCRALEPGLAPSFHGGVHLPGEAAVDPRALSAALIAAIESGASEVRFGVEVCELLIERDTVRGVRTKGGEEVFAPAVIAAVGGWSGVAHWLPAEARPPVRPVKGQILELRGPAGSPVCERIVASERVYLVPRPDGRLLVGATVEERGFDPTVTAGGVHELLREAYRLLPDVTEMELLGAEAGLRPGTLDNLPLIGPGAFDGLLLATGHYRNGVLLASVTGETVARLLAGEEAPAIMRPADPARLARPQVAGAVR